MAPPQGARENPAERKRTRVLVGRPDASGKSKSAEAHTHLAAQPWASRAQRGVPSSTHNESWRAGVQTDRRHAACPAKGTVVPALPAPPAPPPPHLDPWGRWEPETAAALPAASEGRPERSRGTARGRAPHPGTAKATSRGGQQGPPRRTEAHSQPRPRGEREWPQRQRP